MPFKRALRSIIGRLKPAKTGPSSERDTIASAPLITFEDAPTRNKRSHSIDHVDPLASPEHVLPSVEGDAPGPTQISHKTTTRKRRKLSHDRKVVEQQAADASTLLAAVPSSDADGQKRRFNPVTVGRQFLPNIDISKAGLTDQCQEEQEAPKGTCKTPTQKTTTGPDDGDSSSMSVVSVSPPISPAFPSGPIPDDDTKVDTIVLPTLKKSAKKTREAQAHHKADLEDPRNKGWSKADRELLEALVTLGDKPVMPSTWAQDFPTFPKGLFAEYKKNEDEEDTLIRPTYRNQTMQNAGVKFASHLDDVIEIGTFARDGISLGRDTHERLTRPMQRLYEWIREEAYVKHTPPNLLICKKSGRISMSDNLEAVLHEMLELAKIWERAVGHNRTSLYVVVCRGLEYEIMSFVADGIADVPKNSPYHYLRAITTETWELSGHDVWTAFRFTLLAVHCRDLLVREIYDDEPQTGNGSDESKTQRASCTVM